jgi:hypothetical protein
MVPFLRTHSPTARQTALEVMDVSFTGETRDQVAGRFRALTDAEVSPSSLTLSGWAVGREQPAIGLEVVADGQMVARATINQTRPDIARQFPDCSWAKASGFQVTLEGEGRGDSELLVQVVLDDETRAQLGSARVRVRRRGILRLLLGG